MRRNRVLWVIAAGVVITAALTSVFWCVLVYLFLHLPEGMQGAVDDGQDPYHGIKNILELLSFFSGPLLVLVTIVGFAFTILQLRVSIASFRQAERNRSADIYMRIVERWNSDELVQSRAKILDIGGYYTAHETSLKSPVSTAGYATRAEYLASVILHLRSSNRISYRDHVAVLVFFEDIGNLCLKNYVLEADIFDFMGSQIAYFVDELSAYINAVRTDKIAGTVDKSIYAGAIDLRNRAKHYISFGGGIHTAEFDP